MKTYTHILLLIIGCILISWQSFAQQPGTLDKTFGTDGKVIVPINSSITSADMQGDKILISGGFGTEDGFFGTFRYLPDGTLDKTFGDDGAAHLSIKGVSPYLSDIAVLPDNSILMAGDNNENDFDVILAKFKPDGAADSSFGINGSTYIDFNDDNHYDMTRCYVLDGGKILICGSSHSYEKPLTPIIIQCMPDGSLNKSFGNNGKTEIPEYEAYIGLFNSIGVQKDGKIIASGFQGFGVNSGFIARLQSNGIIDSSFGKYGVISGKLTKSTTETFYDMLVQKDDKIIVAGTASAFSGSESSMLAIRYNADGTLDKSFNSKGFSQVKFDDDVLTHSLLLQSNDKIVLGGYVFKNFTPNWDFGLARLTSDGLIDSTFGVNGRQVTDFGDYDVLQALTLQPDGKIIAAGEKDGYEGLYLARYIGDPIKQQGPLSKIKRWIKNHILNWQSLQDDDVSYYSVEQSNGVNGFKEIAQVKSQKSKVKSKDVVYSFDVSNASANGQQLMANSLNNYRIRAISNDGSNVVSDIISDESVSSITVSPNPVKNILKISGLSFNQKSTINIINRNGNILQSAVCNTSICNINVAQLRSGLYNAQIITNGKIQTVKFIKE